MLFVIVLYFEEPKVWKQNCQCDTNSFKNCLPGSRTVRRNYSYASILRLTSVGNEVLKAEVTTSLSQNFP